MPDDHEPINNIVVIASQLVIGLNMYLLSSVRLHWLKCPHAPAISWSGRQPSKHGDVTDISSATYDVHGKKLDIEMQYQCYEKYVN